VLVFREAKNMSLDWLEKNSKAAAKGIDLAVSDMFKTLGNPTHMQVLESLEKKPQKFNELEKSLGIHPQTLSRDLRDLQAHKLATKHDDVYHITKFGSHVIVVTKDLSEKAKASQAT